LSTSDDLSRTFSGAIPKNYDELLGPAWFGPIAADLVRRVAADPGGDVLELACGTGLMTRPLRARLDPRRRLVATDLNAPMLEYAKSKLADLDGITWQTADAAKLPFGDGPFAAVACSLGVMFVPDKAAFFSEARRVLKPGGTLYFNVWDRKEENPCVRAYGGVLEEMFPGDKEIHFNMPYQMYDEALLRGLVTGGGFRDPKIEKTRLPVTGVTPREVATGQIRGTPRGVLLAARGVDFDAMIERVGAALEKLGTRDGKIDTHCQVIAIEAVAA
jgi:SAM-dependent methyltransferase